MNVRRIILLVLVACSIFSAELCMAGTCVDVNSQPNDSVPGVSDKKADYAIAAISDREYQANDPACVSANMRYLGLAHVERAVPTLINLLGYRVIPLVHFSLTCVSQSSSLSRYPPLPVCDS